MHRLRRERGRGPRRERYLRPWVEKKILHPLVPPRNLQRHSTYCTMPVLKSLIMPRILIITNRTHLQDTFARRAGKAISKACQGSLTQQQISTFIPRTPCVTPFHQAILSCVPLTVMTLKLHVNLPRMPMPIWTTKVKAGKGYTPNIASIITGSSNLTFWRMNTYLRATMYWRSIRSFNSKI